MYTPFVWGGMARTLSSVYPMDYNCPHLTVLYDGLRYSSQSTDSPRDHPHTFRSSYAALPTSLEGFPVPGCVAAGHPQLVWPDRLAGIMQVVLAPAPHYRLPSRLRVIVTPAVYPRLVEFLHFDIQSTVGEEEEGEHGC